MRVRKVNDFYILIDATEGPVEIEVKPHTLYKKYDSSPNPVILKPPPGVILEPEITLKDVWDYTFLKQEEDKLVPHKEVLDYLDTRYLEVWER